jgi:RNA polymerase sigma factor (TIGR02999 family)
MPEKETTDSELSSRKSEEAEVGEVTRFLRAWAAGDKGALQAMIEKTINKLKATARQQYASTKGKGADRPTELVSFLWERLNRMDNAPNLVDSKHFYAYCARVIKHLLIDRIRQPHLDIVSLDEMVDLSFLRDNGNVSAEDRVIALELLDRMEKELPRPYEVFYNKKLLGFKDLETAEILGISVATIQSRYALAKAWLYQELNSPKPEGGR